MSYSFTAIGTTKEAALASVKSEFAYVVEGQPIHAKDEPAAVAAAGMLIDLLPEPSGSQSINIGMHGNISWNGDGTITGSNLNVTVNLTNPPI